MSKMYETLTAMTRATNLAPYAKRVVEWNDIARKARGSQTPLELQMTFVKEEFNELYDALRAGDRIEVVDAACDLFVVATYAGYIATAPVKQYTVSGACMYNPDIHFSMAGLETATYSEKPDLLSIIEQTLALCFMLDVNLKYNLEQVLSSNDSKYPQEIEVQNLHPNKDLIGALEQECRDIETRSNGRYKDVTFKRVDGRVVFFDGNGKIMKPGTFTNPKIIA